MSIFQSPRDVPMSAQANGLGNADERNQSPNGAAITMNPISKKPKP